METNFYDKISTMGNSTSPCYGLGHSTGSLQVPRIHPRISRLPDRDYIWVVTQVVALWD